MMNQTLIKGLFLIFTFVFSQSAGALVKVEYRTNPVHGLVNFTMAITGEPRQSDNLIELYRRSSGKTPEVLSAVKSIQSISSLLHSSLRFPNTSKNRASGTQILIFILQQSILASDLKDLSQRTLGLMPVAEHRQFFEDLKKIQPLYLDLVWKENVEELKKHKILLENLARKVNLDKMFTQAEVFYRTKWPQDITFTVALYPIPYIKDFKNGTISQSLGSVEEHGVMIGGSKKSDTESSFGVIFHEICHSLYDAQSAQFMKEFEGYFSQSSSPYKNLAYHWLNEGVATALGNGWAYSKANGGVLEKDSWYNDTVINGYSQELYPLVKSYVENGKALDQAFALQAIEKFAKKFPNSIYDVEILLNRMVMLTDEHAIQARDLGTKLRKEFFVSSYSGSSPLNHPESIEEAQDKTASLVVVYSEAGKGQLVGLGKAIPFVQQNLETLQKMKARSVLAGIDQNARAYFFIRIEKAQDIDGAIKLIKNLGQLEPKTILTSF